MAQVVGIAFPDRALIKAGVFLFLLGLLTGFAVPALAIPKLGLVSHLEGLMNGLFLLGLGLIWGRLRLGRPAASAAFFAALYGGFANWLATLLAGVWGGSAMMPMAAGGKVGGAPQEMVVSGLLVTLSLAMVLACVLVLWGLRRARTFPEGADRA